MRWFTGKGLALDFGLVAAMLALNALLAYFNIEQLAENDRRLAQSHEVLTELNSLSSALTDAEAAQRGFVITGERDYLQPYADAPAKVRGHLERLQGLVTV